MTIDWTLAFWFLATSASGFWAGQRWYSLKTGLRIQKAIDEGSVLPWGGKAYVISPVPHAPEFPGFARQAGAPTGLPREPIVKD